MELQVKQLFEKLLRPLTSEEYNQLSESIQANGCEIPLMIWKGIIIDGHNRYQICREHGITFNTTDRSDDFDDETAVMCWILENALGRRNLGDDDRKAYIGELYNLATIRDADKKARVDSKGDTATNSIGDKLSPAHRTAENIGKQFDVSGRTVRRYGAVQKMGYEAKQLVGDEFDQGSGDEAIIEFDEFAQDQPSNDFNQGEMSEDERKAAKQASGLKSHKSKSKGIQTQKKSMLRVYEIFLNKIQSLRLDLTCNVIEPDYQAIYISIEADRASIPAAKARFGR